MDVSGDLTLQWVEEVGNVIHEEVICGLEAELVAPEGEVIGACEEVAVEETVESVPDVNTASESEILMVPQSTDMDSIYIVPQDQAHDYLNIQVTEEVIADNWDRAGPEDGLEIQEAKVSHDNLLEYDDMEIPLPIDQDSYTNTRPYPCDFCSRRFRKKANLMNHMVAHQTDRPHGCNLCGARYVRKCDLMNHLKIHAYAPARDGLEDDLNDDDPLATEEEESSKGRRKKVQSSAPRKRRNNTVMPKRMNEDIKMEMGNGSYASSSRWNEQIATVTSAPQPPRWPITDPTKPYVCQYCGVGFAREKALASHSRIHGGDSPFECTSCGDMFWDMNGLREHVRLKHGTTVHSDNDEYENDVTYTTDERLGEFYCNTCGVPFHRLDLLKRHQKIHIKRDIDAVEGSSQHHVCNVCGEWFEEALALLAHAELHARSPARRCLLCGEKCRDDAEVAEHVRQNHAEDAPPNTCTLCGKTCKDKRSLLKHSWVHNVDKTFGCTKCGKRFHSKARLRRHMVSHRNKMVACDECGEEFPDGRALVSHRHSHNKELGGRTFPCRECGKTFGSRSSQQIHIRIHTGERPYGCRFCWKAFADGGTLRKHERIHTGEKPYGCAICPRAFNQRVVLREHVRAHHSGPDPKCVGSLTPYLCKVCGDSYPTSEEIVAHIVQHCDDNTALRRQPQQGPRKYKRRRKLKPHEAAAAAAAAAASVPQPPPPLMRAPEQYEMLEGASDSDDNTKRKLGKKNKQHRSNVEEGFQNVLKSFESSLQNINSIVSNSKLNPAKSKLSKKKLKKEEKKSEAQAASQPGRPKMIHTQKTRVPVEIGSDGVKKGQKTKTMVTRTPKVLPNEHKVGIFPGGERNRPRTKNVSYHIEGKLQMTPATFPRPKEELSRASPPISQHQLQLQQQQYHPSIVANIKMEPLLDSGSNNMVDHRNNNGTIGADNEKLFEPHPKKKAVVRKVKRQKHNVKREPVEHHEEQQYHHNNRTECDGEQTRFNQDAIVDGASLHVAFEASVKTEIPTDHDIAAEVETESVHDTSMAQKMKMESMPVPVSVVSSSQVHSMIRVGGRAGTRACTRAAAMNADFGAGLRTEARGASDNVLASIEHVGSNEEIGPGNVKLSVKVESAPQGMLGVHSVITPVDEVSETIIPDIVEYTCEMCSAVFSSRAELLVHVPIHI